MRGLLINPIDFMVRSRHPRYQRQHITKIDNRYLLKHEQKGIMANYDFIHCHYKYPNGLRTLVCEGTYDQLGIIYKYEIRYNGFAAPKVHICEPPIPYSIDYHMYSDSSLCLYYPRDQRWSSRLHLYTHTIPWVHEWILYYEIYKISGKWEHPAAPHGVNKEKV